ncbi:MAG: galactokinase [Phycisphaerae bacterium]|jgi:galactokinase|nr:galactokinase [Phycisphaerae bacterium]
MTDRTAAIRKRFGELYRREASGVVSAPGRVNLIGEHTDYNDGFVLPIAIDRCTLAAFAPADGRRVNLASVQQEDAPASFDLDVDIEKGSPKWANYPKGVAAGLVAAGVELVPMDILFDSDVPIGGGLSSSASLEVSAALAMLGAAGREIDDYQLALICQKAEHEFAGTPCGIMDQAISIMARPERALLLDCRDGSSRQIPLDNPDLLVLVADTKVKHDLTDGGYAARRDQCYSAAAKLGVKMLRDADADMVSAAGDILTDKELTRARHVVSEIDRTLKAVSAMESGDYATFGELMYASHASLRDDYEVSCEELDEIVQRASQLDGVYGARMTGGGFGGCAIILASADRADDIARAITDSYTARFGHPCVIFATRAATGAVSNV